MIKSFLSYFKSLIPQNVKNYYHFLVALFSVAYFRCPAKKLKVIGVTGTDGKTTTSTLIYEFLRTAGKNVALISTISAYIGSERIDTGFHVTAPDPWPLQRLLRKVVSDGFEYVVLEATSHGLDQHRLLGANFQVAVLTNITREHLDYHKTYENYVLAKSKIFRGVKTAIINKSDKSYKLVKSKIPKTVEVIEYDIDSVGGRVKKAIFNKFPETYNRLNASAAYFATSIFGIDDSDVIMALKKFNGVEGGMEEVKNNRGFRTIVDFAHTPNALESVLSALRKQKTKEQQLIAVFGCASERDEGKRPLMGEISTRLADITVFTAEDPRREDPQNIIDDIISGIKKSTAKYYSKPDRADAIDFAINNLAKKGDIVVICGKGHEQSMNIGGIELPWDDRVEVKKALQKR